MSMLQLSLLFFWSLIGLAAYNAFWTALMAIILRQRRPSRQPDQELPKAAVLLSLRGADPNLANSLKRLLAQDYPNYNILIAVDSERDPAWEIVQQTIRESGADNVHVAPLRQRLKTCSLKCSSLVQLLDEIDDSYETIVLADADLESHATWLRELVAPLADPRVGAAFGNRWFIPAKGWVGSFVRQLCNGPAVVIMHVAQIPWGGSLAFRASVAKASDIREKWSHSIVDDGPVRTAVKEQGMKLHFVPSLLMANREDCDLTFASDFLRRQLTWTSTYVRSWWPAMLAYTLVSVGIWGIAVALCAVCLWRGETMEAALFGSGAATLSFVLSILWVVLDVSARNVIRQQGELAPSVVSSQLLRLPLALLLAVWVHVRSSLSATFGRRISWRGVTYEIRGPWDIRMLDDSVLQPTPNPSGVSI